MFQFGTRGRYDAVLRGLAEVRAAPVHYPGDLGCHRFA